MHPLVSHLIAFDIFTDDFPLAVDCVYADANHPENFFQTALYKKDARIWGHVDLVTITLLTSRIIHEQTGYITQIKDCLRPIDAQRAMGETDIVKQNPHWLSPPHQLISKPGMGGHPRGMAVDIILLNQQGEKIDMGTPFDFFSIDPEMNPAARDFMDFPQHILDNRGLLENAMIKAATLLNQEIIPLPEEWWDFRFPPAMYNQYDPLSDADLPPMMRMSDMQKTAQQNDEFLWDESFLLQHKKNILKKLHDVGY